MPGTYNDAVDDNPELSSNRRFGSVLNKPKQAESEEDTSPHQSSHSASRFTYIDQNHIKPNYEEFTRVNKYGLIELDIERLERKFLSLNLEEETTEVDPTQKAKNMKLLQESMTNFFKMPGTTENSSLQTEQGKRTEKLTEFKYEQKNKLWDRKPHLRSLCEEFSRHKIGNIKFTEEALQNFSKALLNFVEADLHSGLNILRRIAYPKLCEKHFSPEFPIGDFAEEDEPVEDICISMDHFEFLHQDLSLDFLDLFNTEDINNIASNLENDPKINNIVPSFVKFLKDANGFQFFNFPQKCFTVILAILKNPYRTFEYFYDDKLSVVKEQTAIAEYLVNCFSNSSILADEDIREKLAETVIRFANVHSSFHAKILAGFTELLSKQTDNEHAYQVYCKVLNIMSCIGAPFISSCLPQHFERISCLAANDSNKELYFHLLKACEILIVDTIENYLEIEAESSDEKCEQNEMNSFYSACYNYFKSDLTIRLLPIFKKYKKRKDREEQYLSKNHAIFPTKYGYMDTEMRFLNRRKIRRTESKSSYFPRVKENKFDSDRKIVFCAQLGYIIQKDDYEQEDKYYSKFIKKGPLSYLDGISDTLARTTKLYNEYYCLTFLKKIM